MPARAIEIHSTMKSSRRSFIPSLSAACLLMFTATAVARTWTSADGAKTFEGELKAYDKSSGKVTVTLGSGKEMTFHQDKLSQDDIKHLE